MIFEVLCLIGTVFGTASVGLNNIYSQKASVVQIIIKYSLYGHVLPVKEKHLSDWPIIAKASCLLSSE